MPDVLTRPVSIRPPGTALVRYLMAKASASDMMTAIAIAEDWRDTPTVRACLEAELHTKAAVAPGSTSDASWAAPLAPTSYGIASEALTLLRGASILGALEGRLRRVPPRSAVPREIGSGTSGAWVGEGEATPLETTAFDTVVLGFYKAGTIVPVTKELLKLGDPVAEAAIRETIVAGLGAYFDLQFLSPAITLVPNIRPASVTNGAVEITSTGATMAAIQADLAAMRAAITPASGGLVWIMRTTTMAHIAAALGAASDLPNTLSGLSVIVNDNSPAQVTLLAPKAILFSDDGNIELSLTDKATLQMNSTPDNPATATTVMTPLWQLNLWAVRVMRYLAWLRTRDDAVAYMTVSY